MRLVEGLSYAAPHRHARVHASGIINIAVLLILLLFICTAQVQLFAKVGYNKTYDEHANFRSFHSSAHSIRFTTGEGWGIYMFDVYEQVDSCVSTLPTVIACAALTTR